MNIDQSILDLMSKTKSCMLATVSSEGMPEASTTPYLLFNDKFYLLISELASHTENLKSNPNCSLMICEDEADTKNIFARKRLILKGITRFIERQDTLFEKATLQFEEARGNTVALLKSLNDFHLVELTVEDGNYVEGFGAAYRFTGLCFDEAVQQTGK